MNRIIVADDEPTTRFLVAEILKMEGYEVYEAEDGEQVLAMFDHVKPQIVILDVVMPKLDGNEVAEKLTEKDEKPVIIMLSAKSEKIDFEKGFSSGADYFLKKPFNTMELITLISNIRG